MENCENCKLKTEISNLTTVTFSRIHSEHMNFLRERWREEQTKDNPNLKQVFSFCNYCYQNFKEFEIRRLGGITNQGIDSKELVDKVYDLEDKVEELESENRRLKSELNEFKLKEADLEDKYFLVEESFKEVS